MVDDIIQYGKLDEEAYEEPDQLKKYLIQTAEQYGFTVEEGDNDHPGITAETGDHLVVDHEYIDNNPFTYLWPELMKDKIETRIAFLRGFYEDQKVGPQQLKHAANKTEQLNQQMLEKDDKKSRIKKQYRRDKIPGEEATTKIKQIDQELEEMRKNHDWYKNAETSQAMLYMLNDQINPDSPEETFAKYLVSPAIYQKDTEAIQNYVERITRKHPWLAPEAQDEIVNQIENINQELEQKAEQKTF